MPDGPSDGSCQKANRPRAPCSHPGPGTAASPATRSRQVPLLPVPWWEAGGCRGLTWAPLSAASGHAGSAAPRRGVRTAAFAGHARSPCVSSATIFNPRMSVFNPVKVTNVNSEKNIRSVSCKESQFRLVRDRFLTKVSSVWHLEAAHCSTSPRCSANLLLSQTVEHLCRWSLISEKSFLP